MNLNEMCADGQEKLQCWTMEKRRSSALPYSTSCNTERDVAYRSTVGFKVARRQYLTASIVV